MFAIHLRANNDTNGNPRRVYLVCGDHGPVAAVDEGYSGEGALREAGFVKCPVVWDVVIVPGEYRRVRKRLPDPAIDMAKRAGFRRR